MRQHSPGPWTVVDDYQGTRIEDASGIGIMSVNYAGDYSGGAEPTIIDDADASLIAAAPDLLRELENCLAILTAHFNAERSYQRDLATARAAIAKATQFTEE